ncbi:MAG: NAD(P)/FAD-dependent oxidoreductase, partial [Bdellovibrionota bacterium]|nr:NAD(P)/FAD-dependent oxidoreductase [Bdellovibrionota bacterium]
AVYALSKYIREELERNNKALITIDLKPDLSLEEIKNRFHKKKAKESMSNFLRRSIKLNKDAITLLNENKDSISPELIKDFKVTLNSVRPIDEAISTAGGVCLEGLTTNFESKEVQGLYFCGEMLNYEAPTGGYLLQGCFSTAFRVTQNFPDVTPRK